MNDHDVAVWLQAHPQFFEQHAEMLATVRLVSPHGQRAVSLQERQMEVLRDKNRSLELRLAELLRYGQENDLTQQRLHAWLLAVLAEQDPYQLPHTLTRGFEEIFEVPYAALRLWNVAENYASLPQAQLISEGARQAAGGLTAPYCGSVEREGGEAVSEAVSWLEAEAEMPVQSLAMVALHRRHSPAFGLLVLGSPDPRRFHDGMGTAYLQQIGDLASAALSRLLAG